MSEKTQQSLDLAIVSSPLQYLNAVEHHAVSGGGPAELVLIGDRHGAGEAIEALMRKRSPWTRVHRHGRRPRPPRYFPHLIKDLMDANHRAGLERLAAEIGRKRYRKVAFGDYRNVSQRLLVDRLERDETVLLDDGSVTPQAAAFRAAPAGAPEPRQFNLAWFRTKIARSLLGDPHLPEPETLTFFTIYDRLLEGRTRPGDALAHNDYAVWRGTLNAPREGAVWLLGADHAEAGICSEADYWALVLAAVETLRMPNGLPGNMPGMPGNLPVIYRKHRGESAEKVAKLVRQANLTLSPSRAPVELDYIEAATRPSLVVAIASSAVDTLAVIDPDLEIARIALPERYLRKRADHIRAVVRAHDAFNPRLRVLEPKPAEDA